MKKISEEADFSFAVHNGDLIESMRTERGAREEKDREAITKEIKNLEEVLGCKVIANVGNHESGYSELPLVTDPQAGISAKSVINALEAFGRKSLYHSFEEDGHLFVFLPYIFMEKKAVDFDIEKEKERLIDRFKEDLRKDLPVILFLHDPDALALMFPFLNQELDKIENTFCGHLHAQWTKSIYPTLCKTASSWILSMVLKPVFNKMFPGKADAVWEYFSNNKENGQIWDAVNLSVIPAPSGMMGIGGGFLVADLTDDGIKVQKIKVPRLKKEDT